MINEARREIVAANAATKVTDGTTIALIAIATALIAIAESLERLEARQFEASQWERR